MRRTQVPVREYMSRLPVEMQRQESIDHAWDLMQIHHIRHVPVLQGAQRFGIVSLHDVLTALADGEAGAGAHPVETICETDVVTVSPMMTVPGAAVAMDRRKVGSTLVVDDDVIVGILTAQDVVRYVADLSGAGPA